MATEPRVFGELLRRYRVAANLTQEALAEKAGLSARGLSDLERGLRQWPHSETVRRLVVALGLDPTERAQLVANTVAPLPPHRSFANGQGSAAATWPTAVSPVAVANQDDTNRLPVQLTSFVGRENELAQIRRLLSTTRLLTLTGPGGIGKTRLALQVVQPDASHPAGSVQFVDLAPLADASLVPQTVASSLGVREQPDCPVVDTLAAAIRDRSLLLILDNCEHLVRACRELADTLLRACPRLRILSTSRGVLGVSGETIWSVPPLALPDARSGILDDVRQSEAASLFVERARTARPGFALDERTAPAVAAICLGVDGLPLGIELAAARLRVLAVDQIAERLHQTLSLLVGGPPTVSPRHQALRTAIDWSYGLLGESERQVFERTSVFSGGWTIEAAEAVCAGDLVDPSIVLDQVGQLVDQSLVVAEPGDDRAMRFRLLEPLRQYAAEKLENRGGAEDVRRRHAEYYTHLGEQLGFQWAGHDLPRLARLEAEDDNTRAALRWMIDCREAEPALQLAGAAAYLWQQRGRASEGQTWLFEILALPAAGSTIARARALIYASVLIAEQGDYATARPLLEEALTIARELGDGPTLAFALFRVAQLTWFRREFAAAREFADEGVGVGRAFGLRNLEGINLWQSAQATHDLGEPGAEALAEEALAILTEVQNPTMIGCALTTLAQVHLSRGDLATARRLLDGAVAVHPRQFQGVAQMFSHVNLGWVATEQADVVTAYASLLAALRMGRDALGGRARLVTPLEGLAQLAAAVRQPARALRLAGAAANLRRKYSTPPTQTEVRQLQRWLARARADLTGPDAAAAWTSGEQLTPDQAVEEALALDVSPLPESDAVACALSMLQVEAGVVASAPEQPHPMTSRERQVALLVARGLSNPQIARELVIGERTAQTHVGNILSKLGLSSRAEIAVWVTVHHQAIRNP
jgi:predicted ATPase/DNA-binding CsgD family transcriptional regulator/transcriptional regulator with XRE-family HTH domain